MRTRAPAAPGARTGAPKIKNCRTSATMARMLLQICWNAVRNLLRMLMEVCWNSARSLLRVLMELLLRMLPIPPGGVKGRKSAEKSAEKSAGKSAENAAERLLMTELLELQRDCCWEYYRDSC